MIEFQKQTAAQFVFRQTSSQGPEVPTPGRVPEPRIALSTTAELPIPALWSPPQRIAIGDAWCSEFNDRPKHWLIEQDELPEGEPYRIIAPIPVAMRRESETDFEASIDDANLAATGNSAQAAFENLICEMLDAYDYFDAHQTKLGPGPLRQWSI